MNYQGNLIEKKNNILYIITSLGLGGAEKLLLEYLNRLDTNKYRFHLIILREKPDDLISEINRAAEIINLKVKNKFNPVVIIQLYKLYKLIKPDIIHTHLFQPRVYATIAKLFYKRAILITHKHNNVNLVKHNIFILLEMLCILANKKVVAISQSVKISLMKYEFVSEKKIQVIPNAIDFQRFNKQADFDEKLNEKQIIIGNVGRLEKQKGLPYLLTAMKLILLKYPNVKLEIIGDGSFFNELKKQSNKLNISNSVIFFGKFVNVIPFYKRMDIFVLPSIYEGFGIVLLEAMAAGVPIVATNVDGIKEVVINGESGILVPPKNPEAIAEAVMQIINNPQLKKKFIEAGLKRAQLFDIKEHIMKLDNLYTNLLLADTYR